MVTWYQEALWVMGWNNFYMPRTNFKFRFIRHHYKLFSRNFQLLYLQFGMQNMDVGLWYRWGFCWWLDCSDQGSGVSIHEAMSQKLFCSYTLVCFAEMKAHLFCSHLLTLRHDYLHCTCGFCKNDHSSSMSLDWLNWCNTMVYLKSMLEHQLAISLGRL